MTVFWIWLLLAQFVCIANGKSNEVPYVVEFAEHRKPCDEMEVIKWSSGFHDCFLGRKANDGGQNLETIVDRILEHAVVCIETSSRPCLPSYEGFKGIMNKTISQIKDYSEMYLSEIYKGKENYKDVRCVEEILRLETYTKCFRTLLQSPTISQKSFEWSAKEDIHCANKANEGCSIEAKSSLNRIVGKVIGVPYEVLPIPTTTQAPPPPPKRWWEYITQPFVAAWEAIKSFFG
ncbi:hypothetical protein JTE90_028890 [Oedothorax gibbosus]|uniref:Uncharacterized protein n=1 Tax=Oedothorax gibbosus TaxID=931172 RepID=A0AAV6UQ89_9ARAC|nr:hypothetical protein JTE90_028890 [Oedothorax gibbosus]